MSEALKGFVYFDVGGVVINDFSANTGWTDLKRSMGIGPELEDRFSTWWNENCQDACTTTDVDDLVPNLEASLAIQLDENYSLVQAFVDRFHKNKTIWPVIETIHSETPVGLLTNMYPRMFDKIAEAGLYPNTKWDIVIDSSVVKMEKPNSDIYMLAQEEAKVRPEHILFIDNTKGHLDAAKSLGWNTVLYDPSNHEESCKKVLQVYEQFISQLT